MTRKLRHHLLNATAALLVQPIRVLHTVFAPLVRLMRLARFKSQCGDVNPTTALDGRVDLVGTCNFAFGDHCRLGDGVQLGTEEQGRIVLGSGVRLNRGVTIFSYNRVSIGDSSLIGEYATIRDANHGIRPGELIRTQDHEASLIHIGSDVWIGRGACVLPGVTIGDGAVIGANSVVTKSVPANVVAAGVPARVIRER